MLTDILRAGFARAAERPAFVLLDILWKAVWLVSSVTAVILVVAWFGSRLQDLAWEDTGVHATNALIALAALREFWRELKGEAMVAAGLLIIVLSLAWFALEAFVHARMIYVVAGGNSPERGLKPATTYLIARLTKAVVLTTAGIILVPVWFKGAPGLAVTLFLIVAFCLTVVETLIRADAVELFETDLIRVTALIGILMSIEMTVAASFAAILADGFLHMARMGDALGMLGLTGITAIFLSVLHSYLLLVRFSAVGIMRENVVAV